MQAAKLWLKNKYQNNPIKSTDQIGNAVEYKNISKYK